MAASHVPELDDELRRRLGRRLGAGIESWLDELPPVLVDLSDRWQIDLESLVQRGSVSVVIRCRTGDGRPAVLKVSPERRRIVDEATALARWRTVHVPAVLAVDDGVGALLIEAVEPGSSLSESRAYPSRESLAALMSSLHADGVPDPSYPPVAERIAYLYESGRKNYERRPDFAALISPDLYERGRQLALRLAADAPATVEDGETIAVRAKQLAPLIGVDALRLSNWCAAFAAMTALEVAEASPDSHVRVDSLVAFARAQS